MNIPTMTSSNILRSALFLAGLIGGAAAAAAPTASLPAPFTEQLNANYPAIETLYQDLHRNPELGFDEHKTAAKLAELAKKLGFEVTTGVGGTGVVAIMKNGPGPTVMLRTEMDALPVQEKTGLAFASKATGKNAAGEPTPVMHACGHDLHMSAWYGTAKLMAENRKAWSGTLMLVGQPSEETVHGAEAMLKDGLFKRFPKPDYALSFHDDASMSSGTIMYHAGPFRASSDVVNITVFGQGGHGAVPHEARDPIVIASRLVLALQTLVSRENNPLDPVVITVGSIHGGTVANIIPDQVKLSLSVRTFKPEVRQRVLASIAREAKGEAMAAGAPKEPLVDVQTGTDSVYNDPELIGRVVKVVQGAVGPEFVKEMPAKMTSEDFSQYGQQPGVKAILLHIGAVDAARLAAAKKAGQPLPGTHSPQWAPDFKPTVTNTIKAETAILLDLMAPKK
jgi:hippurate hydrolase